MMSWQSCMNGKINDKFGPVAAQCASSGSSGNLQGIVTCIVNLVSDANPVSVLADLTGWSLECAFEDKAEAPKG